MLEKRVLVGGCFNRIHPGHIYFLKQAKKLGDKLFVVLTNDKNNKKLYSVPAAERKRLLESLNIADKVLIGNSKNKAKIVGKIKPHIIVLGYDQELPDGLESLKNIQVQTIKKLKVR